MRQFSSYGPIDKELHYYVPRRELHIKAYNHLIGLNPDKGGHYITVWAPRQTGKSSLLLDIYHDFLSNENYYAVNADIQHLQNIEHTVDGLNVLLEIINEQTGLQLPVVKSVMEFQSAFSAKYLAKPLILIIDEFDALPEKVLNDIVGVFRNIYHARRKDPSPSHRKHYLLHGVALIGVRTVVGVENKSGSPFNVQRSLHLDNLTEAEVYEMYHWYEQETSQTVEQEVIKQIYHVTRGQPGLVSWFGELLTETYNDEPSKPLTINKFKDIYTMALKGLPNNTVINIISKAETEPYGQHLLNYFRTGRKQEFRLEKKEISYFYMNGIISYEKSGHDLYVRFSSHFIQEKLFDHFADELVQHSSQLLVDPFADLTPVISKDEINICRLLELYQEYYAHNREELTRYAQRRGDLAVMEVVYHFQFYSWLDSFLKDFGTVVLPEFPTGNGKIDLLIRHGDRLYGLELKSFSQLHILEQSIVQASEYGRSLGLDEITLVIFSDRPIPDQIQERYTKPRKFAEGATVNIFFLIT